MIKFLKSICLFAAIQLIGSAGLMAQQEAMYSQYMFNGLILNPAYAGSTESLSASALYRRQWMALDGAPTTQTISVQAPINNKKVGLGFTIINDQIAITRNFGFNGAYAYRIHTANGGAFSMGLQSGIGHLYANYNEVSLNPQNNPDNNFMDVQSFLMFNFGTGLYYNTDKFYAGLSIPYLYRAKISGMVETTISNPQYYRHYFLTSGYVFDVNDVLKVKPSGLIKLAEGAPLQFDINTNLWFYEVFGIGASYRSGDSMVGMLEFQVSRQFRFSYAYDHPVTKLARVTSGSHELMLRFDLVAPNSKYVSTRFF
ncbi:MAG: type IX secretion system membrane protein PorP/SprF [Bacteroidota bacterium]|nr:type IX secretion system membrane protein PorP/SprF [Bacteroidota bacterium]